MHDDNLTKEELDEIIDKLSPQQAEALKDKTIQLVVKAFEGLKFAALDEAVDEHRTHYELLKALASGPMIGMVRQMVGDIDYVEFAKLMIFLGLTALAQKDIHAAVMEIGGQPAADKPKRFEVNLSRLPKLN
jgi:hypothetical protein